MRHVCLFGTISQTLESDWILPHFLLHKGLCPTKNRVSQRMLNYGLFQDSKFLVTRSTILLCFPWKFKLMCNNSRNLQQCSRVTCLSVWEPQLQALFWLRNYDSKDLKTWSLKLLASPCWDLNLIAESKKKKKKAGVSEQLGTVYRRAGSIGIFAFSHGVGEIDSWHGR